MMFAFALGKVQKPKWTRNLKSLLMMDNYWIGLYTSELRISAGKNNYRSEIEIEIRRWCAAADVILKTTFWGAMGYD